ncbi:BAK protein, partial [Hylia prasina]|nr:BAK protein [Hylia prasina]
EEAEEQGPEMPLDPEIEQIQQDQESTWDRVGQRLATIGDDIYAQYDAEFHNMLEGLHPTPSN